MSPGKETEMILYHDYVIFAGDLNFRLEEGAATLEEVRVRVRARVKFRVRAWVKVWIGSGSS